MVETFARLWHPDRRGVQGELDLPAAGGCSMRRIHWHRTGRHLGCWTRCGGRAERGRQQQTGLDRAEGGAEGGRPPRGATETPKPDCQTGDCLPPVGQVVHCLEAEPALFYNWAHQSSIQGDVGPSPILTQPCLQGSGWAASWSRWGSRKPFW